MAGGRILIYSRSLFHPYVVQIQFGQVRRQLLVALRHWLNACNFPAIAFKNFHAWDRNKPALVNIKNGILELHPAARHMPIGGNP